MITLDTALNFILRSGNYGTPVTAVALHIADLIETEHNILKIKELQSNPSAKPLTFWQKTLVSNPSKENMQSVRGLNKRLRKIADEAEWTKANRVKVGCALLNFLIESAKTVQGESIFEYSNDLYFGAKKVAWLRLNNNLFKELETADFSKIDPRYLPMVVKPKKWNNQRFFGAYFYHKAPLMKVINTMQSDAVRQADIGAVLEALNFLGNIPWKVHEQMFKLMHQYFKNGDPLGEIPSGVPLKMPKKESCFRPSHLVSKFPPKKSKAVSEHLLVETLDAMEEVDHISDEFSPPELPLEATTPVDEASACSNVDPNQLVFDEIYYRDMCKRVQKKNYEIYSIRCDLQIKLSIAEKFLKDTIYFPHQMDFRGRAYPIPPNLSHLGSDLCRGLLRFAEAKPLGDRGFWWLKVHLSNLFGHNKVDFEERVKWTDQNLPKVFASAKDPTGGEMWWTTAESPVMRNSISIKQVIFTGCPVSLQFQALSTCFEIVAALESGNPATYLCNLPVHQDGSCNGLQHYAGNMIFLIHLYRYMEMLMGLCSFRTR